MCKLTVVFFLLCLEKLSSSKEYLFYNIHKDCSQENDKPLTKFFKLDGMVYIVVPESVSWIEANSICKAYSYENYWIGAKLVSNIWTWLDGSLVKRNNITEALWTNNVKESCAAIRKKQPLLVRSSCFSSKAFICQREEISRSNTISFLPAQTVTLNDATYTFYYGRVSWYNSVAFCRSLGERLAVVPNKEIANKLVSSMLRARPSFENVWVGGYCNNNQWKWISTDEEIVPSLNSESYLPLYDSDEEKCTEGCVLLERHWTDSYFLPCRCERKRDLVCEKNRFGSNQTPEANPRITCIHENLTMKLYQHKDNIYACVLAEDMAEVVTEIRATSSSVRVSQTQLHRRQAAAIAKVKTKPRTLQPKKVKFVSTEVRCQEKTRGGLCYEVILSEPDIKSTPPKRPPSPSNNKNVSIQDIEDKLKAAEERRQQFELNKVAALSAQIMKIEEATRKKDEQTNTFISTTREALEQKMETHLGKREAYINDLKTKMKDHIENVEKTRLSLEQQCSEVRSALEDKMKSASVQRDENIKKMLDRLKEHEDQVLRVRASNADKFQQLENTIQEKLEQAQNRREQYEQEQIEKLRSHNTRAVEIKSYQEIRRSEFSAKMETKLSSAEQNREKEIQRKLEIAKKHNERHGEIKGSFEVVEEVRKTERTKRIESKLTTAEINREKEIQKKLEVIKKNERRAELVRQNKASITENHVVASSG